MPGTEPDQGGRHGARAAPLEEAARPRRRPLPQRGRAADRRAVLRL